MKRDGDIVSMFQKNATKKRSSSTPVVEEEEIIIEEIVDPSMELAEDVTAAVEPTLVPVVTDVLPPTPPQPPSGYDVDRLPHDPGERLPIASYHANDQDAVRRAYILRGPFQLYAHEFQKGKLEIEIEISHVYGLPNMIG